MSHIQFILYFAISSIPSDSPLNPIHEITNTLPSLHLLLEAMSGTNKHLIYPSSAGSVYGNRNENAIELTPLKPSSSYALGKVFSEDMIKFYGSINKIQYSILRFSNIYGSITRRKRLQGIIDHFLDNTILQKKSSVWGSLDTSRDFLYVEDAASAILEIIKAPSHAINEIYNIASGKAYRIQDVLEIIQEITEGQHQYETSVGNFTGPVQTLIDVKKFKNAYPNWQLRFDLYQGILRSWQQKINSLKGVQHDADD
jgi:UDP-glucose 4-epimerase